jgi:hypothetical protein
MFGLAAVRRERIGDSTLNKFDAQSIFMIAVGRCPHSNELQFYNPLNDSFVSSIDYKFQPHSTSSAHFGFRYQPGSFIYRLDETNTVFMPKFTLDSTVLVHSHSPPHRAKIIGLPTYDRPDVFTVLFPDGWISEYADSNNLLEAVPSPSDSEKCASILPHWIKSGANATVFLTTMTKPKHGKLFLDSGDQWVFCAGHTTDISKGIILHDLTTNCQTLLDMGQLFRGHTKFRRVYNTRSQLQLRDAVLRHVSAHGLTSLIPPSSLQAHHKFNDTDKKIWDDAYSEEFDGLSALPTWDILTESQFKSLSSGAKALPSIAIATIKYDLFNRPKRAKYRIVVLGNHD